MPPSLFGKNDLYDTITAVLQAARPLSWELVCRTTRITPCVYTVHKQVDEDFPLNRLPRAGCVLC